MPQTVNLIAIDGVTTPTLYLRTLAGAAIGEAGGYALTEVTDGHYQITTIDDAVTLLGAYGQFYDGATFLGGGMLTKQDGAWFVGGVPSAADTAEAVATNTDLQHQITRDLVESQRDDHARIGIGNVFYVDPVNGDTHANGARGGRLDPYSSLQDCLDNAVVAYNHDVVFLVPSGGGLTTLTEQVVVSKAYTFIRGPGTGFLLTAITSGDLLTITGEGVEVSSLELKTHTAGNGAAVVINADMAQLRHATVSYSRGDGVQITGCSRALVEHCRLYGTGQVGAGDGIAVDGSAGLTQFTKLRNNVIIDTQGDGVSLTGANVLDTVLDHNIIHDSTGWGIRVGNGVTDTVLSLNAISNNASGDISDSGTNTHDVWNDDWLSSNSLSLIGDAVAANAAIAAAIGQIDVIHTEVPRIPRAAAALTAGGEAKHINLQYGADTVRIELPD